MRLICEPFSRVILSTSILLHPEDLMGYIQTRLHSLAYAYTLCLPRFSLLLMILKFSQWEIDGIPLTSELQRV